MSKIEWIQKRCMYCATKVLVPKNSKEEVKCSSCARREEKTYPGAF